MENSKKSSGSPLIYVVVGIGLLVMIGMLINLVNHTTKKNIQPVASTVEKASPAETPAVTENQEAESNFSAVLNQTASEVNKSCPMMIDKETRLDNCIALPNKTFQYNYTLVNMVSGDYDTGYMSSTLKPGIVNNIRTSPSMEVFRQNRVTIVYSYSDMNGTHLFQITVTPEEYGY